MSASLGDAWSRFAPLVDDTFGIIRKVEVLKLSGVDPAVFLAYANPCDTVPICGIPAANRGGACSVRLDRAVVRACGESVERYCSAIFDRESFVYRTRADLVRAGHRVLGVREFFPFDEAQYDIPGFPFARGLESEPSSWVPTQPLGGGPSVYVPASCVYVPYAFDLTREAFTHMPISTGLAAGPSLDFCIAKGIYEILERDALMIAWAWRLERPRIPPESCFRFAPDIDELLRSIEGLGARFYINDLTLDVEVPVISAVIIDDGSPPLTSFGIAADRDPLHALRLALEEALLTRVLLSRGEELQPAEVAPEDVRTLRDHLFAHAASDRLRQRLEFLTHAREATAFEALVRRYSANDSSLQDRLRRHDLSAFWVDVTTEDVGSLGFRVVRTLIPTAQPLHNDHRYRYLGGARLQTVPRRLGLRGSFTLADINPDPHPFP
jgi:ribosomal protein S12 methylthiotransferase accessory factor